MTVPLPSLNGSGTGNTPGRTVAIWGKVVDWMVAITLPPKAGRVMLSTLSSRESSVQSAVSPVSSLAATRGASSLPRGVAPNSTTAGSVRIMICARLSA